MSDYDHDAILSRLDRARGLAGETRRSLARKIGMSDDAVNVWFKRKRMAVDHAPQIAYVLRVSPAWLLFGEEPSASDVSVLAAEVARLADHQAGLASEVQQLRSERAQIVRAQEDLASRVERLVQSLATRLSDQPTSEEG